MTKILKNLTIFLLLQSADAFSLRPDQIYPIAAYVAFIAGAVGINNYAGYLLDRKSNDKDEARAGYVSYWYNGKPRQVPTRYIIKYSSRQRYGYNLVKDEQTSTSMDDVDK